MNPYFQAAQLIQNARHALALTGAGISTASGIPDFRSPESGLWSKANPMEIASLRNFRYEPQRFYDWMRPIATAINAATPNAAHNALATLEQTGYVHGIITQNIDLLHSKAGSQVVFEVHGHTRTMTCIQCFRHYEAEDIMAEWQQTGTIPSCQHPGCGGVLKPDVILFGEQLPAQVMIDVEKTLRQCDVLLIAGSSLEVFPVADIPRRIKRIGGKLIIINLQSTDYDHMADVVLHEDVTIALPRIVSIIKGEQVDE